MPEMNSSPFAGFIEISPPLSPEERGYINAFKKTRRVDRVQGPYFVTTKDPTTDDYVVDPDTPAYGQPSVRCHWEIAEDGSRIVFDETDDEFEKPLEWMVYLINHFLRLKPFVMEEFSQVRDDYGIPNFSGHICNGHIQCRKHHNIVVENNHVGKELSWPNSEVEWLNEPEPVFEAMQDYRDKKYKLPDFETLFDPVKLFSGGSGRNRNMIDPAMVSIWDEANKTDEWPESVTKITREDVEKLKAGWAEDPMWDLEDTEGFEAYHDELKAFSDAKKAEWEARREEQERKHAVDIQKKADRLECSFGVAQYLTGLEDQIRHLQDQVDILLEHSDGAHKQVRGY